MEALSILKFWRSTAAGADVNAEVRKAAFLTDDDEMDDEDSFFDLVFKSPDPAAKGSKSKKDFHFIESPRDVFNDFSNSKHLSPKFKVFMLGFKKSPKLEKTATNGERKVCPFNQISKSSKLGRSTRFSMKCRVAEMPAERNNRCSRCKKQRESFDFETSRSVSSVPKYLKLINPFHFKIYKKTKSTRSVAPSSSPVNLSPRKLSDGSRVGSFKIATRNLVKSRSASASAAVDPPSVRRRDDSLLEKHDGIQGAILHCKKSYNSSSSQEVAQLYRCSSESLHENLKRNSCEEKKRCSI